MKNSHELFKSILFIPFPGSISGYRRQGSRISRNSILFSVPFCLIDQSTVIQSIMLDESHWCIHPLILTQFLTVESPNWNGVPIEWQKRNRSTIDFLLLIIQSSYHDPLYLHWCHCRFTVQFSHEYNIFCQLSSDCSLLHSDLIIINRSIHSRSLLFISVTTLVHHKLGWSN